MSLKIPTGPSRNHQNSSQIGPLRKRQSFSSRVYYVEESHKIERCLSTHPSRPTLGRGQRPYGIVNLKVDCSQFLNPSEGSNALDIEAIENFSNSLSNLATTRKGCIVWFTLNYFEKSNKVIPYVDQLLSKCLYSEFIMDETTKNFLLISNIVTYGEKIKFQMINSLKRIHEDLSSFGFTDKSVHNPQLFLKYYDHNIATQYYKLISLLFFRFRKDLDNYGRRKVLAGPALSAIRYLMNDGSVESLGLLTRLVQLNLHSLAIWFYDEVMKIVEDLEVCWGQFKTSDRVKYYWISGCLDIAYQGPILPKSLYDRYSKLLGAEWAENVTFPPVQILGRMNEFLISEKQDCFFINDDDIIRNMFVYLP